MTYESTADIHRQQAERATFTEGLRHARELLAVAQHNLEVAERDLAEYEAKEGAK